MNATAMADQDQTEAIPERINAISSEGKNKTDIRCPRCPSLVLRPSVAQFKRKEVMSVSIPSFICNVQLISQ